MKNRIIEDVPYCYQNAPIPGGGFVTGFVFHNKVKDILYARTDIGGVYRFDFKTRVWKSLMDHVIATRKWESYSLSIALDDRDSNVLYVAAGDHGFNNFLCRSYDRGATFEYFPIPARIHGNAPGRGTGERLQVDPGCSNILYFGSQTGGLLVSYDRGETWSKLDICPSGGAKEENVTFVWLDPRTGNLEKPCLTIVVSVAGEGNAVDERTRGKSLYISTDGGEHFEPLPHQPEPPMEGNYRGFVGQRAAFDGEYLYVTMCSVVESRSKWNGYSCDNGGVQYGSILRYRLNEEGIVTDSTNITPSMSSITESSIPYTTSNSFGGIAVNPSNPYMLICTSQCSNKIEDAILCSMDKGDTWNIIMQGLKIGKIDFSSVSYMKPEYNGGRNLIHWMSDIKIDPFCHSRAIFNTGTGIFMTENLEAARDGEIVIWAPVCEGVEETVHLNVYSPPAGEVHLIDMVGDLGGFAFTDVTKQCNNSFADANGNRYITCLNGDYSDHNPMHVAVTARGNWSGFTTGGLIWSEDQCKTWRRLPDPIGLTPRIDGLIEQIHKPNTNSGWTAFSADEKTLIWCVGEYNNLPADAVVYTSNLGETWERVEIFDEDGVAVTSGTQTMKVLSDRINGEVFYGFGDGSLFYISVDGGRSFHQLPTPGNFPKLGLGGMDGRTPAEIRVQANKSGTLWIATGEHGLWRIVYELDGKSASFQQITDPGEAVYRQGMGAPAPSSNMLTLYVNGTIGGNYGFYRSFDEGETWQRINTANQMYGDIRSIIGDSRTFGRFYIASGSRGVLWGEPCSL